MRTRLLAFECTLNHCTFIHSFILIYARSFRLSKANLFVLSHVVTKATDAVGDGKSPINFVFVELLLDIGNHHVITTLSYL